MIMPQTSQKKNVRQKNSDSLCKSELYGAIGREKQNGPFNGESPKRAGAMPSPRKRQNYVVPKKSKGEICGRVFFWRLTYFVNTETFPKNIRRFWYRFPKQCPSGPRTSVGCGSKRSESYTISPWSSWCWCLGREKESEGEFLFPIKKNKKVQR